MSMRPLKSVPHGSMAAILAGLERLAIGAEPRSSSARADLLDRCAAAEARFARAAVHAKFVLHPASGSVRVAVITKSRALAGYAHLESGSDGLVEPCSLGLREAPGGPEWMDPGAPESLVRIDVPDPGRGPLIEERRLNRGTPTCEGARECRARETALERLPSKPSSREVLLQLARLEELPRPETANVVVRDIRSVV